MEEELFVMAVLQNMTLVTEGSRPKRFGLCCIVVPPLELLVELDVGNHYAL